MTRIKEEKKIVKHLMKLRLGRCVIVKSVNVVLISIDQLNNTHTSPGKKKYKPVRNDQSILVLRKTKGVILSFL